MNFLLTLLASLFIFSITAEDLVIDSRGYYQNDEIIMYNGKQISALPKQR